MKCLLLVSLLFATINPANAYVSIRSSQSGAAVRWGENEQLTFRTNTTNSSGMSSGDIFTIFTTSLNRWKQAARNAFGFQYFQGTDTAKYPNYTGSPYDNSIFFTSNGGTADRLQCGVIALTQVWFSPTSGAASKADLRFNDNCYTFTNNPLDTSSQTRIFLGDVATHELGHALGLDHSQSLQSTMIYTAALEMAKPSCDDQAAMVQLYSSVTRQYTGTVSGQVTAPGGAAVFGAHVQVFQLERGVVMATGLSDKTGAFAVSGLEPGTYGVLVEPYYPGAASLSPYYSTINSNLCNGSKFERTFQVAGGQLQAFTVTAGGNVNAGTIAVSCAAPVSANSSLENSFSTAPVLAAGNLTTPLATQSVFSTTSDHYYKLLGQSGRLSVEALSFSLFSRSEIQVELLNSAGQRISQVTTGNVFTSGTSGYVNYDANATADLASAQDVYVHVFSRSTIATTRFPSGSLGVSNTAYYVLTASRGTQGSIYPNNSRCSDADSFGVYASQGEAPGFSDHSSDDVGGSGGCGTIRDIDHDPMGPGGSVRLANFAGMALFLLGMLRLMRGSPLALPRRF